MQKNREYILNIIVEIINQMLTDWGVPSDQVGENTYLSADLGLSSMDALNLMATLDAKLGVKLPYERLVMPDTEYVTDLKLGQLAEFAAATLDDAAPQPRAML